MVAHEPYREPAKIWVEEVKPTGPALDRRESPVTAISRKPQWEEKEGSVYFYAACSRSSSYVATTGWWMDDVESDFIAVAYSPKTGIFGEAKGGRTRFDAEMKSVEECLRLSSSNDCRVATSVKGAHLQIDVNVLKEVDYFTTPGQPKDVFSAEFMVPHTSLDDDSHVLDFKSDMLEEKKLSYRLSPLHPAKIRVGSRNLVPRY